MAMGRSKLGPSFFYDVGLSEIDGRAPHREFETRIGQGRVETRSRDSLTAASGNPTMVTTVSPQSGTLTSTSTGKASMPLTAADKTRASIGEFWGNSRARAMRFFAVLFGDFRLLLKRFRFMG